MARLRVYALCDPTAAAREKAAIARIVLGALGATDPSKHEVIVGPSSGWLSYRAIGEVWDRKIPPTLTGGPEAKRRAEQAIGKLAAACSPANPQWPKSLANVALFPQRMKAADLSIVPRAGGSSDHWLYRAQPELYVDEERRRSVPVMGTMIEVRVGHLGQIVSVTSQWRSTTGEELLTDAVQPAEHDDHGGQPHSHSPAPAAGGGVAATAAAPVNYAYILDGAALPQHYLAPYVQVADHHGAGFVSGCAWALTVVFGREQRDEEMVISAEVHGGSGDYRFAWATYLLESPDSTLTFHDGQTRLVDSPGGRQRLGTLTLENGAYVLMVNVKDRATGAFKHFQQQVFSHPLALPETDEPGARVA